MVGSFMILLHGLPKLLAYGQIAQSFPDPLGIGSQLSLSLVIFAEFFCSILLIMGTGVRFACIPLMITMFVAAFIFHANDPVSKIELPLMYFGVYMAIVIGGAGKYALKFERFTRHHPILRWGFDV